VAGKTGEALRKKSYNDGFTPLEAALGGDEAFAAINVLTKKGAVELLEEGSVNPAATKKSIKEAEKFCRTSRAIISA